jgi:hypothetical protein
MVQSLVWGAGSPNQPPEMVCCPHGEQRLIVCAQIVFDSEHLTLAEW